MAEQSEGQREDFERDLDAIGQTDPRDLTTLLKLTRASREEFKRIVTYPVEEQAALVSNMIDNKEIYQAVGDKLERWSELDLAVKMNVIGTAYDILSRKGEQPEMVTYEQVAEELGLTNSEVVILEGQGKLRGFRLGGTWQYRRTDVERVRKELGEQ